MEAFSSPTFSPHPIFSSLLGANLIIESCGWNVLIVPMGASLSLQTPCLHCSGVFIPMRIWLPSWRISSPLQAGGIMPPTTTRLPQLTPPQKTKPSLKISPYLGTIGWPKTSQPEAVLSKLWVPPSPLHQA